MRKTGTLIIAVVLGILLLILLNKHSDQQKVEKRDNLSKQQLLLPEKWQKIFNEMTPEQHLSAIKNDEDAINGHKHLEALAPGSPERKEADKFLLQKAKDHEAKDKAKRSIDIISRKAFARELELMILDKLSMDTKVQVEGKENTTLRIKGALIGRAMAHQMFNKAGIGENGQKLGFKIVIFENSIDHSWWKYTLD